ncbi:hypothetical protein LXL04_015718 [Taraxacum kok-saghyz]
MLLLQKDGLAALVRLSNGDMRKSLNNLLLLEILKTQSGVEIRCSMSLLLQIHHHIHLELLVGFVLLLWFLYEPVKMPKCHKFGAYAAADSQKMAANSQARHDKQTSQVVSDVPYGDYICVEGLWDVVANSNNTHTLKISIVVLLLRPQRVQVVSDTAWMSNSRIDRRGETELVRKAAAWLWFWTILKVYKSGRQQRKRKQDKVQHWFWLGSDQIWKVSEQIVENWTKNVKVFSYGVQICKIIRRKVERQQMVCRKVLQLVLKWFDHVFMNWTKNVNNLNYRVHQMGKKMIKGWDQSEQMLHTCLNNSFYCWRIGRCNTGGFLVFLTAPIKSSSYGDSVPIPTVGGISVNSRDFVKHFGTWFSVGYCGLLHFEVLGDCLILYYNKDTEIPWRWLQYWYGLTCMLTNQKINKDTKRWLFLFFWYDAVLQESNLAVLFSGFCKSGNRFVHNLGFTSKWIFKDLNQI